MYEAYYHLKSEPFRLSPDPKFCFQHRTYRKAMVYMQYALNRAEGFIMITGQPGTGKTTLINDLLRDLHAGEVVSAKIVSTQLAADDLLRLVTHTYGMEASGKDKADLLIQLERFFIQQFRQGRRALLIVDEAQDVPLEALEELRLLTNMLVESQPLLQIFLVGQEELRDVVSSVGLVQLHQRLIAASHLEPLDSADTTEYIKHRLQRVGWDGDPVFSNEAYKLIQMISKGIPREINQICSRLLLHGSTEELHRLGVKDVKHVVNELDQELLLPDNVRDVSLTDAWYADEQDETYEEVVRLQQSAGLSEPQQSEIPEAGDVAQATNLPAEAVREAPLSAQLASAGRDSETADNVVQMQDLVDRVGQDDRGETGKRGARVADAVAEAVREVQESPEPASAGKDRESAATVVQMKGAVDRMQPDTSTGLIPGEDRTNRRDRRRAEPWRMVSLVALICGLAMLLWFETSRDTGGGPGREFLAWIHSIGTDMPLPWDRQPVQDELPEESRAEGATVVASAPPEAQEMTGISSPEIPAPEDISTGPAEWGQEWQGAAADNTVEMNEAGDDLLPAADPDEAGVARSEMTGEISRLLPDSDYELSSGSAPPDDGETATVSLTGEAPVSADKRVYDEIMEELEQRGLVVTRLEGNTIMVNLSGDGVFDFDSVVIREESATRLSQLADVLRLQENMDVKVVGHTDSAGQESYNLNLSQRRASAVADYLSGLELPQIHIQSEGRGDLDTRHEETTRDKPHLRRRVEIYITPVRSE